MRVASGPLASGAPQSEPPHSREGHGQPARWMWTQLTIAWAGAPAKSHVREEGAFMGEAASELSLERESLTGVEGEEGRRTCLHSPEGTLGMPGEGEELGKARGPRRR